jgi:hypothetical protein
MTMGGFDFSLAQVPGKQELSGGPTMKATGEDQGRLSRATIAPLATWRGATWMDASISSIARAA